MYLALHRILERARSNIKKNMVFYLIVFFVFMVGVMTGGYSAESLPSGVRSALSAYIDGAIETSAGSFAVSSVFFQALFSHMVLLVLIALCGLSVVFAPISMLALLFRGFLFGFAALALIQYAGVAGTFAALLCVVLPGLLLTPCYLYIAADGLRCGVEWIKLRGAKAQNQSRVREYVSKAASAFLAALVGIAAETLVVPLWLRLMAGTL